MRALDGVLRGVFILWVIAMVSGVNNVLIEYSQQKVDYENPALLGVSIILIYVGTTLILTVITFKRDLQFELRAGLLLFALYILGTIGLTLSSLSGDGRVLMFAFIIFAAVFFDRRYSLTALILAFATYSLLGYLHVSEFIYIPLARQANSGYPAAWLTGGAVLLALSIAILLSVTYLLQTLEQSLKESRAREHDLTRLYNAAQDMAAQIGDPISLLRSLARHMAEALQVTSTNIVSVHEANGKLSVLVEYWSQNAAPSERFSDVGSIIAMWDYGTIMTSMLKGEAIILHEDTPGLSEKENWQFSFYGIKSMLFVPIMAHGKLLGDAEIWESRRRREFTESEVRLVQAMAGHAAAIMESAQLFAETRQRESELSALLAVARAVSSSLLLEDVLKQAATTLASLLRVDFCSLSDYLPEQNMIVTTALYSVGGDVSGQGDLGHTFSLDDYPLTRHVLLSGEPAIVRLDDPDADQAEIKQLRHDDMFSFILIPLRLRGQSFGLAELFTADPGRVFTPDEVQFVCALAEQVAVALENARLYEKLEERESHFRALIENSAEGVAILDEQGRLKYLAPSEERLTGYTPEELLGQNAFRFIHPEDQVRVAQIFAEGITVPDAVRTTQYRLLRKDGVWRHFEIVGQNMLYDPHIAGVVVRYRDITDRKLAEQALEESEERYRTIFQSAGIPIWEDDYSELIERIEDLKAGGVTDFQRYSQDHPGFLEEASGLIKILDVNTAVVEMMEARSSSDLIGALKNVLKGNAAEAFLKDIIFLADGKKHFEHESHLYTLQGNRRDVWVSVTVPDWAVGYERVLVTTLDVTERKRAEDALRENRERLSGIVRSAPNGIIMVDSQGLIVVLNPSAEKIFAWPAEELIGQRLEVLIPERYRIFHDKYVRAYGIDGTTHRRVGRLDSLYGLRRNGEEFPMEAFISSYEMNGERYFTVVLQDITERRQAEAALQASEMKFRALAENIPGVVYQCNNDETYSFTYLNDSVEELTGYPKSIFLSGELSFVSLYHPDDGARIPIPSPSNRGLINQDPFHITYRIRHRFGHWVWVDEWGASVKDAQGGIQYLEGIMIDITSQKEAEEALRQRTRELEMLTEISFSLRVVESVSGMGRLLVARAVQLVQGVSGSIFLLNPQSNTLMLSSWYESGPESYTDLSPEFQLIHNMGEGITGRVAETGEYYITEDIHQDPTIMILPDEKKRLEKIQCGISLPLPAQDEVIGVLHVWLEARHEFTNAELRLLTAIAEMAGSALHRASLYEKTIQQSEELSEAYDNTLAGWARALELRDEPTEGHTRRVTELTLALAMDMGIVQGELVNIQRGAILHDIGKMGIPDSILHKPGPLSAYERTIMCSHAQLAYDMLSPISFLESALDIPYCHHERWDGAGYPRGLKAEQIPLAARIFAVVDVWDALISDRPYRSAWSHGKARAYIADNAGKHFDPDVVKHFLKWVDA